MPRLADVPSRKVKLLNADAPVDADDKRLFPFPSTPPTPSKPGIARELFGVKLEVNVPIPPRQGRYTDAHEILKQMEPGESFLIPGRKTATYLSTFSKTLTGKKFVIRIIKDQGVRVWRLS